MKKIVSALVIACAVTVPLGAQIEVTSTGVGLGTASPARKLDVGGGYAYSLSGGALPAMQVVGSGGNSGLYGGAYFVTQSSDTAGGLLVLAKAKSDTVGTMTALQSGDVLGAIHFWGADGSALIRGARIHSTAEANASSGALAANLIFSTSTANSSNEILRLTSAGNIGIGTTTPTSSRLVVQNASTGFGPTLSLKSGGTGSGDGPRLIFEDSAGEEDLTFYTDSANEVSRILSRGTLHFHTNQTGVTGSNERLTITNGGNVGIGSTGPTYKLEVAGTVRATSFISDTTTYADFVFKPDYKLASLAEVEAHIADKGHLPGIPSEAEAKANGIDLAAMQVKLLQKVEELTLYVIEQQKRLEAQQRRIDDLTNPPAPTPSP